MQSVVSGTAVSGVIPYPTVTFSSTGASDQVLPAREILSLRVTVGGREHEIHPLPPENLANVSTSGGVPDGYVVTGDDIRLIGGSGSEDYTMLVFAGVPALASGFAQNWLLTREPALYLYGALIEAAPYLRGRQDDLVVWSQQFRTILDRANAEDSFARYGNAPAMKVTGCAP